MTVCQGSPKRILGFDFGLARIGVAIGQTITQTASPVTIVPATQGVPNWHTIESLLTQWSPDIIVVGIPKNMDDSHCSVTQPAQHFLNTLQQKTPLPVYPVDERLTTKEARAQLQHMQHKRIQKTRVDALAACLIVETWINTCYNVSSAV